MCVILLPTDPRCNCCTTLPDKPRTPIRLCPYSIDTLSRTPCNILTFPPPSPAPLLTPACPRCSAQGTYVFTLHQAVRGRKPGTADEYTTHHVQDELRTRFSDAVEFCRGPGEVRWDPGMRDGELVRALREATDAVFVPREKAVLHDSYGFWTVEHQVAMPVEEGEEGEWFRGGERDLGRRMIKIALGKEKA